MDILLWFWSLVVATVSYSIFRAIQNIFFHPLTHIPGPKLAAASRLYEWYYDCVLIGQYCFKIRDLHDEYGPIIRIGPNEIHIRDSDYFDILYANTARLDKDPWFYGFLDDSAAFNTSSEIVHQRKISKVEPYFSKANVQRKEAVLMETINNFVTELDTFASAGRVTHLKNAFKSYATDVVCAFCFPESTNYVQGPDFSASFHRGQEKFARIVPWFRFIPGSSTLTQYTPDWLVSILPKDTKAAISIVQYAKTQVKKTMETSPQDECKPNLLSNIFKSELPAQDRTPFVLEQEAIRYIAAGTGSTARCMENAIYHILSNPTIKTKLTTELRSIKSSPGTKILGTHELEQLPYLAAVVQESLRCFPAIFSRFPRINRKESMSYGKYTIPSGTVVGMSNSDVLSDPSILPNPEEFIPERWLDPTNRSRLLRYQVPFLRGSRNCVGQNLAMAEMVLGLGNLVRRYDMSLYETAQRDVEVVEDCYVPLTRKGSLGVRVLLNRAEW